MMDSQPSSLSEREEEILRLIATGASNKEIAQQLVISTNTVKVHARNIFAKIGVASRTEAAMYAVKAGLVEGAVAVFEVDKQTQNQEMNGFDVNTQPSYANIEQNQADKTTPLRKITQNNRLLILIFVIVAAMFLSLGGVARDIYLLINPQNVRSSVELLDETRWSENPNLPNPRKNFAVTVFEGEIFTIAGETADGVTNQVESFNPETDTWKSFLEKPVPVTKVGAAVLGGKIYIPGGLLESGVTTSTLEIFDPRQNLWEKGKDLPVALCAYSILVYEGEIYIFGGWDGVSYRREVYNYDPGTDTWYERYPMPLSRADGGAAISGGKVFLIGGQNDKGLVEEVNIYQPGLDNGEKNPWSKGINFPTALCLNRTATIADIIFCADGSGSKKALPQLIEYFPGQDQVQIIQMPVTESWDSFGMVNGGGELYLLGGQVGDSISKLNMSYQAIFTILLPIQQ